ncbi:Chorismate synthase [Moraxella ovis]|nr:Chorismate synthase [Moraxella ovis]
MSGNTIGQLFTVTTCGESHGVGLWRIVDGSYRPIGRYTIHNAAINPTPCDSPQVVTVKSCPIVLPDMLHSLYSLNLSFELITIFQKLLAGNGKNPASAFLEGEPVKLNLRIRLA